MRMENWELRGERTNCSLLLLLLNIRLMWVYYIIRMMAAAAAATDVRDMQPFVSTYCASTVSAHVIITHSGRLLASNRDTQVAAAAVVVVAAAAKRGGGGEGACASLSLSHPCDVPRAYSLGISVRSRSSARPSVRPSLASFSLTRNWTIHHFVSCFQQEEEEEEEQ